jgi:hypothetical protein
MIISKKEACLGYTDSQRKERKKTKEKKGSTSAEKPGHGFGR